MPARKERVIISNKLVIEKTGKTLEECFLLLDKKGAGKLNPPDIYKLITEIPALKALGAWNQNLLSTSYQWSRGLKQRGEKKNGFEISISKTINAPVSVLYSYWLEVPKRKKWLKENISIRKSNENKSIRITWSDQITSLSVDFYARTPGKCQVVVQHMKLPDSKTADSMKTYWSELLELLKKEAEK